MLRSVVGKSTRARVHVFIKTRNEFLPETTFIIQKCRRHSSGSRHVSCHCTKGKREGDDRFSHSLITLEERNGKDGYITKSVS